MTPEASLAILKALADKSRLAIVGSLLERPHYVEELAQRHALAASTISFHLRKLEQAGLVTSRKEQYYVVIAVNDGLFDTTLRQVVTATPGSRQLQEQRIDAYRRKVLAGFFRHGRLEKLPAQHKKRRIVLEEFAARFVAGRRYSESDVTELITPLYADYCTIRRLLVDEGLVHREGLEYWLEENVRPAGASELPAAPAQKEQRMTDTDNRREIKRTVKQQTPPMGIYRLRCTANDRAYVAASRNLEGERNSRLFQLRMGKVVFSPALQRDLDTHGPTAFVFEVLAELTPPKPGTDPDQALAKLELAWLEKLQPFGERGYNSERKYRRERERLVLD